MQPKEKLRDKILSYYFEKESGKTKNIGQVADKVGLSTQTLRDIVSGRSQVTLDVLLSFTAAYPADFGGVMDEVMGLETSRESATAPVSETAEDIIKRLTDQLDSWNNRYDKLANKYEEVQTKFSKLNEAVIKKYAPELSFNESSSRTTVIAFTPIGYEYDFTQKTEGKVVAHPATMAAGAKVMELWAKPIEVRA